MGAFDKFINAAAKNYKVSPEFIQKLIQYESRGDPNAVSPTGARGLGQFTKGTGAQYGLNRRNVSDPGSNIDAIARLTKNNAEQFTKIMGRPPSEGELYLAHLQGVGGVTRGLQNPTKLARDLWPEAVRFNTPASAKGRLNTMTAKEYQDLHQAGFNKARSPTDAGTIDIGDKPDLKTLNPNANPSKSPFTKPVIPLSQLAPTEANTMARSRYPDRDEAVRQAMAENVQLAGNIPTGAVRPKIAKVPKTKANQAVKEAAETEAAGPQPPNREGPYDRTAPGTRGMEGGYSDYVKSEQGRMAGEAKRANELRSVPNAGEQIGAPANPRGVRTESFRRPAAVAGGAAAVTGGVSVSDPAVSVVEDYISGQPRDPAIDARQRATGGPEDPTSAAPSASYRAPSMDPNQIGGMMKQVAPIIKDAMQDPQVQKAAKVVSAGMVRSAARMHAQQADMQNDPTYYQQVAARNQQMPGGGGGGDPIADRAMERAVMMDRPGMRAPSAPQTATAPRQGTVTVGEAVQGPPEQGDAANTENQIVQQALNPQSVYTKRYRPTAAGPAAPSPSGLQLPPGAGDVSGGVQGMPSSGQMPMDPAMMQLMQFFKQGGGGVG